MKKTKLQWGIKSVANSSIHKPKFFLGFRTDEKYYEIQLFRVYTHSIDVCIDFPGAMPGGMQLNRIPYDKTKIDVLSATLASSDIPKSFRWIFLNLLKMANSTTGQKILSGIHDLLRFFFIRTESFKRRKTRHSNKRALKLLPNKIKVTKEP